MAIDIDHCIHTNQVARLEINFLGQLEFHPEFCISICSQITVRQFVN